MAHLHFTKPLVGESDELPPGTPSPTGRPLFRDSASSSAGVRGGGGGGGPNLFYGPQPSFYWLHRKLNYIR